ncbi:hypothetical protein F2P81_004642 [Scophthalmus maximus]|uniref:Chitin synthase n=1 Tax=Scophthalmus maximus TaxID=52904 RepID=A0A6A4TDM5_SCOMX|nr:hypothetical protein F2P81_004642 [Scophthalmus maximus]
MRRGGQRRTRQRERERNVDEDKEDKWPAAANHHRRRDVIEPQLHNYAEVFWFETTDMVTPDRDTVVKQHLHILQSSEPLNGSDSCMKNTGLFCRKPAIMEQLRHAYGMRHTPTTRTKNYVDLDALTYKTERCEHMGQLLISLPLPHYPSVLLICQSIYLPSSLPTGFPHLQHKSQGLLNDFLGPIPSNSGTNRSAAQRRRERRKGKLNTERDTWDPFQLNPVGAEKESKRRCFQLAQYLVAVIVGLAVLTSAVVAKGCLLVLSTLSSPTSLRSAKEKQFYLLMLVFCLVCPNFLVFIKSLWKCAFKSFVQPNMKTMSFICAIECVVSLGTSVLVLVVMPQFDVLTNLFISGGVCIVSAILQIVFRLQKETWKIVFPICSLILTVAGYCLVGVDYYVRVSSFVDRQSPDCFVYIGIGIFSSILISFCWWENPLQATNRMQDTLSDLDGFRDFVFVISSILRIIVIGGVYLFYHLLIKKSIIWSDFNMDSDDWQLLQIGLGLFFLQVHRIERTSQLFVRRLYESAFIDLSLLLNTKMKVARAKNQERLLKCVYNMKCLKPFPSPPLSSPRIYSHDELQNCVIYLCATMWHETYDEMLKILTSMFRLDRYRGDPKEEHKDCFDFECHIYVDDAFMTEKHTEKRVVNSYVNDLIHVVIEVYRVFTNKEPDDVSIIETPYGGRLMFVMPEGNMLYVHLKDKSLIRNKKRWSQIMYLYYLLGWKGYIVKNPQKIPRQNNLCRASLISIDGESFLMPQYDNDNKRKFIADDNTYILALDGDTDFQPKAVILLIDRLRMYDNVGAACGRIHPTGMGAFQFVFSMTGTLSIIVASIPPVFYIIVCFVAKANAQITIAAIMSVLYAFLMTASFFSIIGDMVLQGTFLTPTGLFLVSMAIMYLVTAILHPEEFGMIIYGLMYFICIPSGYLLLTIYSLVNMHIVTWGTRESNKGGGEVKKNKNLLCDRSCKLCCWDMKLQITQETENLMLQQITAQSAQKAPPTSITNQEETQQATVNLELQAYPATTKEETVEGAMIPPTEKPNGANRAEDNDTDSIRRYTLRNKKQDDLCEELVTMLTDTLNVELSDVGPEDVLTKSQLEMLQHALTERARRILKTSHMNRLEKRVMRAIEKTLIAPQVQELEEGEHDFWTKLIERYLKPIVDTKAHEEEVTRELKSLRNKAVFLYFIINVLWVVATFFLQAIGNDVISIKIPKYYSNGSLSDDVLKEDDGDDDLIMENHSANGLSITSDDLYM